MGSCGDSGELKLVFSFESKEKDPDLACLGQCEVSG